ncbi:MAG: type II secretion system protein, partial [Planctomycetota bacterium]
MTDISLVESHHNPVACRCARLHFLVAAPSSSDPALLPRRRIAMHKRHGFTLVELLVVIAIIGILVA